MGNQLRDQLNALMHLPPGQRRTDEEFIRLAARGGCLLQLIAVRDELTDNPYLRELWHPATFTPIEVSGYEFDAITCNLAYHFHRHGQSYGTIVLMTEAALTYFHQCGRSGQPITLRDGIAGIRLPNDSLFTTDGRIVTFIPSL